MKLCVLVLVVVSIGFAGACASSATDSPEQARRKAECRRLEAHIFQISPETRGRLDGRPEAEQRALIEELVAKVPIEDIEQCAAAAPAVIACMQAAPDPRAVRACIPPPKKG
jgi:hypothetical protein